MYIGLMSGTSLDGVDGVLADIPDHYAGGPLTMPAAVHVPFPPELRADLMALQAPGHNEIEREALASQTLARLYADCVAKLLAQTAVPPGRVRAIGVHGQTVRHRPELGFTRQINQPALLAELAGIDVIADFRSRDIAAGGQGAPLVPAFHQAVFGQAGETRVVVNIGGIANISLLLPDGTVSGFDTGPGNVLLDGWIGRHRGLPYDANGAWAASGHCCAQLLERMLTEPYLALPPPKSTGRDLFHLDWLAARLAEPAAARLAPQDIQATLTDFTAETIAQAIGQHAPGVAAVYVCGGGAYSRHLMQQLAGALRQYCPQAALDTTEALGIAPNQVEALAFAWLAQRFCLRQPGNLPAVTGARGGRILGALYPA
ncbi:MAG: anhydro-N-acetylmuramic acid kinase [Burkholderiaceae bacterium]|nr:anhydro-N-acetylmuramic acid kinase [Burkholderiaceae bacterium]